MNVGYNERAWAIDLISAANQIISTLPSSPITGLGGERSLPGPTGPHLFPDVLLFGSAGFGTILQGWELKFPDTPADDPGLVRNASEKARRLGTESFLLWNVTSAVLYQQDGSGAFRVSRRWDDLLDIRFREAVHDARGRWVAMLRRILTDLSELFASGHIRPASLLDSFGSSGLADAIVALAPAVEASLRSRAATDGAFDAETTIWWHWASRAYPEASGDRYKALSPLVLTSWISKILFAHVLKRFYARAATVESLRVGTTVQQALNLLDSVADECDFRNVFAHQLGEETLPDPAWDALLQLNGFLSEFSFDTMDPSLSRDLVSGLLAQTRRTAGQFTTPYILASLLSRTTIGNKAGSVLDPCCGSGTIARSAYDLKLEYGLSKSDALGSTWLGDKFAFPLQMAAMAMMDVDNVNIVVQAFREDIVNLHTGTSVNFVDPATGGWIGRQLPEFDYILSNLPFVQQEDLKKLNAGVGSIVDEIGRLTSNSCTLSGKSDLYAYLPFYIWRLLKRNGRAGLIVSNSWLGTDWGKQFREALARFYSIDLILVSGHGRWFGNSKVVTSLILLTKRSTQADGLLPEASPESTTAFASLEVGLETLGAELNLTAAALATRDGSVTTAVHIQTHTRRAIRELEQLGVTWNAFFGRIGWLSNISGVLVAATDLFEINRGERRGWDTMFYPTAGHGIEAQFLRPVLKTIASVDGLVAAPDALAFCCTQSADELRDNGMMGAEAWIARFASQVNGKGKPLPDALARTGQYWYSMTDSTPADIVASVDYGERLFFARMGERSFVNQRLTRFIRRAADLDVDLVHALLNSSLGLLYLEMLGFGRGQDALDLSCSRMRNGLRVLDPTLVVESRGQILAAFRSLLSRHVMSLQEELIANDRRLFDETVFGAYGMLEFLGPCRESLQRLHAIRMAVNDA